ncbi:Flp pilus assembly protein CpaB [Pullulanibacillus sp. KACC 23026]|uniref:Flp pilus assembly protein CpaB n=1 Tax=Pullulanibacillus sp. KACC 23026 TaxID=3028315 RepID=UPI0023B0A276|nr:Flp pilus assembly protein CpaB [Pullulanibacillus sp. KACC 23026]WEG13580.1 Flp pilus assembly protein CpaB [Pullulanibacillus sp. KACC 23026]
MRRFLLLLLALVMAGVTTYLFYTYMQKAPSQSATAPVDRVTVVVAKESIPENTKVTDKMVELASVPKTSLQPDAVTSLDQVIGKLTKIDIEPNEMLLTHHLESLKDAALLSHKIKPGYRAITLQAKNISDTVANLDQPGDHVDVLLEQNGKPSTLLVLSNVLVLAVDGKMTPSTKTPDMSSPYTMTTLEVNLQDAMKLATAEQKGEIKFILRSAIPAS